MANAAIAGYRIIIIFNGSTVGTCTSASWDLEYNSRPVYEIDRTIPREIMPTTYSVKFSLSGVKVLSESFNELGIVNLPGSNNLNSYLSLAIVDRLTNAPLLNIRAAEIESVKYEASVKQLVTFSISGVGFVAEDGTSLVDVENNPSVPPSLS